MLLNILPDYELEKRLNLLMVDDLACLPFRCALFIVQWLFGWELKIV